MSRFWYTASAVPLVPRAVHALLRRQQLDELVEASGAGSSSRAARARMSWCALYCVQDARCAGCPSSRSSTAGKSMMRNLPPNGVAGLARCSVRCLSRAPRPPGEHERQCSLRIAADVARSVVGRHRERLGTGRALMVNEAKGPGEPVSSAVAALVAARRAAHAQDHRPLALGTLAHAHHHLHVGHPAHSDEDAVRRAGSRSPLTWMRCLTAAVLVGAWLAWRGKLPALHRLSQAESRPLLAIAILGLACELHPLMRSVSSASRPTRRRC